MSQMFYAAGRNSSEVSIGDLSDWDTNSVTDMSYMFKSFAESTVTATDIGTFTIPSNANIEGFAEDAITLSAEFKILGSVSKDANSFNNAATKKSSNIYVSEIILKPESNDEAGNVANTIISLYGLNITSPKGNIHLPFEYATVLYDNGMLVINQPIVEQDMQKANGVEVLNHWDPLTSTYIYNFDSEDSVLWHADRDTITAVKFGSIYGITKQEVCPTDMSYWFYDCQNLINFDSTYLDTSKVTDMSYLFYGVGKTTETFNLDLSQLNTSEVTNMEGMFSGAGSNATSWSIGDISGWQTGKVMDMSSMFNGAGSNADTFTLDLSSWDTSAVTDMAAMFSGAGSNATSWSIGDISGWKTGEVKDMSSMFNGASSNTDTFTLDLSSWDTSAVTNMSEMFKLAGHGATSWNIGDLTEWDTKNVTNMEGMFSGAGQSAKAIDIDLSNFDVSIVTNMSYMFKGFGQSADEVNIGDLSNWKTSNVADMSYMFCDFAKSTEEATNIGAFTIPSKAKIDSFANGASTLEAEINISSSVSSKEDAFLNTASEKFEDTEIYVSEISFILTDDADWKEFINELIGLYGLTGTASEGNIVVKDLNATGTTGGIWGVTNEGSLNGNEIEFENLELTWSEKDDSVGKAEDGWSYGFRIYAPESVNETNLARVKYSTSEEGSLTGSFTNNGTEDEYWMGYWQPVTVEEIQEALNGSGVISNTLSFDWNGDGKVEQTIGYSANVNNITLLDQEGDTTFKVESSVITIKDNETVDYSGSFSTISDGGTVSENGITFANTELKYGVASSGNSTGWWLGIRVTGSSVISPNKVTYSIYETGEKDLPFTGGGSGQDEAGNYYMDIWISVTPETLEKGIKARNQYSYTYGFDWTGNGTIDQELIITIDARNITLYDADDNIDFKTVDGIVITKDKVTVDYSKVEEAIKNIPEDLSIYTDETVKALEDAKAAVDYNKSVYEQAEVNAMAERIENAIKDLVKKPKADYSAVEEALKKVPTDLSWYTEETAEALKEAIGSLVSGLPYDQQDKVDEIAERIKEALEGLVEKPKADYSKLDEVLDKVPTDLSWYTEETAEALKAVIGSEVRGLPFDQQYKVDELAEKIERAIKDLVEKLKADYSKLDEALDKVPTDLSWYTEETAEALKAAIGLEVRGLPFDQQYKVDELAEKIEQAIKDLVEKPKADYSAVDEALKKVPTDLSYYTDETAKSLQEAIESVIRDLPADRQDEVDEMAANIEAALKELVEKPKADSTALYEALKKVPTDLSYYTDETAKYIQEVIESVIRDLPADRQGEVEKMVEKIEEALKSLVEKPKADYSKVDEALKNVPTQLSYYTEDTAKALQKVIDSILRDLPEDRQEEVDEMAANIKKAIKNLVEKPKADYTAVDKALNQVPEDLDYYTEETAQAVQDAIDAVVRGLLAEEQDKVDAMAERIIQAIEGLETSKIDDVTGGTITVTKVGATVVANFSGYDRYTTALSIGNGLLYRLTNKFDTIIVASGVNYADALSGSYLSYVKGNAPILLINSVNEPLIKHYITKNLNVGGTVYILGGTGAVSKAFETNITKLGSFTVKRLAGQNRYMTNIEILKEAGVDKNYTGELLICTGTNYADSVSASAVNLPMLLVSDKLLANQKTYLATIGSKEVVILGGTGAVSASLASSLGKTVKARLAGANRYETSVLVAETFFGENATGEAIDNISLAYGLDFPDGLSGGPLARELKAPLLLVADINETASKYAIEYIKDKDIKKCIVFGSTGVISEALVSKIIG
jgi:surface protein